MPANRPAQRRRSTAPVTSPQWLLLPLLLLLAAPQASAAMLTRKAAYHTRLLPTTLAQALTAAVAAGARGAHSLGGGPAPPADPQPSGLPAREGPPPSQQPHNGSKAQSCTASSGDKPAEGVQGALLSRVAAVEAADGKRGCMCCCEPKQAVPSFKRKAVRRGFTPSKKRNAREALRRALDSQQNGSSASRAAEAERSRRLRAATGRAPQRQSQR
jgi:hypothetical protein